MDTRMYALYGCLACLSVCLWEYRYRILISIEIENQLLLNKHLNTIVCANFSNALLASRVFQHRIEIVAGEHMAVYWNDFQRNGCHLVSLMNQHAFELSKQARWWWLQLVHGDAVTRIGDSSWCNSACFVVWMPWSSCHLPISTGRILRNYAVLKARWYVPPLGIDF